MPRDVDVNGSRQISILDIFPTSVGMTFCMAVSTPSSLVSASKFRNMISGKQTFFVIYIFSLDCDRMTYWIHYFWSECCWLHHCPRHLSRSLHAMRCIWSSYHAVWSWTLRTMTNDGTINVSFKIRDLQNRLTKNFKLTFAQYQSVRTLSWLLDSFDTLYCMIARYWSWIISTPCSLEKRNPKNRKHTRISDGSSNALPIVYLHFNSLKMQDRRLLCVSSGHRCKAFVNMFSFRFSFVHST